MFSTGINQVKHKPSADFYDIGARTGRFGAKHKPSADFYDIGADLALESTD